MLVMVMVAKASLLNKEIHCMKFVLAPLSFKRFIYAVSVTLILEIITHLVTTILKQQSERALQEKKLQPVSYKTVSNI